MLSNVFVIIWWVRSCCWEKNVLSIKSVFFFFSGGCLSDRWFDVHISVLYNSTDVTLLYRARHLSKSPLRLFFFLLLFFSYLSARNKIIPNNPPDTKATNNFNAFTHTLSRPQLCFCRHCRRSMILLLWLLLYVLYPLLRQFVLE